MQTEATLELPLCKSDPKFGNRTMIRKYCETFKNPWTPAIVQIRWVILIIGDLREFGIDWYDCIGKLLVIRSDSGASIWSEGKI